MFPRKAESPILEAQTGFITNRIKNFQDMTQSIFSLSTVWNMNRNYSLNSTAKKMDIRGFEPNIAHKKLAEMEAAGKLQAVITQNIDGLHRKAGSKHVLEIHGSEERNYCDYCEHQFASDYIFTSKEEIPRCPYCGGVVRPDVVLYGEALPYNELREAAYEVSCADCMIIGGTSLNVYPAASLLQEFRGEYMILINRGETPADSSMDLVIRGSIGQVMSQIKVNNP